MKKLFLNTAVLLCVFVTSSFEGNQTAALQPERYSKEKIEALIREVYAAESDAMFFSDDKLRLQMVTNFLNRVDIQLRPQYKGKKVKLLSEIALVNQYNPNIGEDKDFSIEKFNPLKYNFPMSSNRKLVYRVGDTDCIISIEPLK